MALSSRDSSTFPELVRDSHLKVVFDPPDGPMPRSITTIRWTPYRKKVEEVWDREKFLGRGASGVVWLERRRGSDGLRATKEIYHIDGPNAAYNYVRELEGLAKFSQPKYVDFFAQSFGWFRTSSSLYITMEYCHHGDLGTYVRNEGKVPENQATYIAWQVLQGLTYMHENEFAHRDLKPSNILITKRPPYDEFWHVKICDLGLAKRINDRINGTTICGTPLYMAPELSPLAMLQNRNQNRNTNLFLVDMWSFGETMFHILAGKSTRAFPGYSSPRRILESSGTSELAIDFIQQLMALSPSDRLSAKEAINHKWVKATAEEPQAQAESSPPAALLQLPHRFSFADAFGEPDGQWTNTLPAQHHKPEGPVVTGFNKTSDKPDEQQTIALLASLVTKYSSNVKSQAIAPSKPISAPNRTRFRDRITLFVGCLRGGLDEGIVSGLFVGCGPIMNILIPHHPTRGRSERLAFVIFHSSTDAKMALQRVKHKLWQTYGITVDWACTNPLSQGVATSTNKEKQWARVSRVYNYQPATADTRSPANFDKGGKKEHPHYESNVGRILRHLANSDTEEEEEDVQEVFIHPQENTRGLQVMLG